MCESCSSYRRSNDSQIDWYVEHFEFPLFLFNIFLLSNYRNHSSANVEKALHNHDFSQSLISPPLSVSFHVSSFQLFLQVTINPFSHFYHHENSHWKTFKTVVNIYSRPFYSFQNVSSPDSSYLISRSTPMFVYSTSKTHFRGAWEPSGAWQMSSYSSRSKPSPQSSTS